MNRFSLILSAFIFALVASASAQHLAQPGASDQFVFWQDSLKKLNHRVNYSEIEPERYNANYAFIKTLVSALKTQESFNFDFDSLKAVSIIRSSDSRFKLFTWHVLNDDGTYRYYGTIQMNSPDGKLKLFPLVDYTSSFTNPTDSVTTNDRWYGARYYKIIPVTNASTPYYILLGWKGNTVKTTKKVIDIVSFRNDKAYFGMSIFDGEDRVHANKKRIIFEYARKTSMLLNYLPEQKLIIFDHLAPMNQKVTNQHEFYGPDMSYDGFRLMNGRCQFTQDIPLKNPPSDKDDQFIAPKKVIQK